MKWIASIAVSAALACAAVSTDVAIKEIEHQLYIQGAAAAATDAALRLLQDQSLTTDQLARVAGVAQAAALRNGQAELMRTTMTALTDKGLPCDELRNALALGGDSPRDANANRNVREALQYQWTTLDWRSSQVDRTTFDEYLIGLTQRTNLAEVIRVQTSLLRTIMLNWLANADAMGISSNMVTRHYQRLLNDLAWTDAGYAPASVARALERWYATAREYIIEQQPYLAIAAVNNLTRYAALAAQQLREPDVLNVQLSRLNKTAGLSVIGVPNLEPYVLAAFRLEPSETLDVWMWSFDMGESAFSAGLFGAGSLNKSSYRTRSHSTNLPRRVSDLVSISKLTNAVTTIHYGGGSTGGCKVDNALAWDLSSTLTWNVSNDPNSYSSTLALFTGHWPKAVWQQRFDALSNSIWQLDAPLNEIRKYVAATATPTAPAAPAAHTDVIAALRQQAEEALRLFLREGPLCTTAAVAAAKTLVATVSYLDVGTGTPENLLRAYPHISEALTEWILEMWRYRVNGVTANDYAPWWAVYFLPQLTTLHNALHTTQDNALKQQFLGKFFSANQLSIMNPKEFLAPAAGVFQYLATSSKYCPESEQLIAIIKTRVEEALNGADFSDYSVNYAIMFQRCLPVMVRYISAGAGNEAQIGKRINCELNQQLSFLNWMTQARLTATWNELARAAEQHSLNYAIVAQRLAELANGLREDAGLPPSTNNWLAILNAEAGATNTLGVPAAPADGKAALRQQAEEALRLFLREGPRCTTAAVAAAKTLVATAPYLGISVPNALRNYPPMSQSVNECIWNMWRQKDLGVTANEYARWCAVYLLQELAGLEKVLCATKDETLKQQFVGKFYGANNFDFLNTTELLAPASGLLGYLATSSSYLPESEQFIAILRTRLQEALNGVDFSDYCANYAILFERLLPVMVRYVTSGSTKADFSDRSGGRSLFSDRIGYLLGQDLKFSNWNLNWKMRARLTATQQSLDGDVARHALDYQKVVQRFVELANGLREDAGLPPSTNNWVAILNAEAGATNTPGVLPAAGTAREK